MSETATETERQRDRDREKRDRDIERATEKESLPERIVAYPQRGRACIETSRREEQRVGCMLLV